MSEARYQRGMTILNNRLRYEQKLRLYYEMRHDGLPRQSKPFPSAADGHYPLIDMKVRQMKPFFIGQVTSGDRLVNFTSLKEQPTGLTDAASAYLDFTLNQRTPFLRKLRVAFDHMALKGRGVVKATIDPLKEYAVTIEAVDPFFMLMPQNCDNFEDADEWVHVRQFSVEKYRMLDERWKTDEHTINLIRGKPTSNLNVIIDQKKLREGINYTSDVDLVLVWEHWIRTKAGHTIEYYSPMEPTIPLRQTHGNPYKFQNKESIPFFSFQMEVKDEGWYSPRGLAELIAPVEQYMTKLWNEKADAMTFANRPLYTGDKEIVNSSNYRWAPGEYIPGNIKGVPQTSPPFNFDSELGFAMSIAEQECQSPDFGITQQGKPDGSGGKPRTATENERISALQQSGTNDNAMILRDDLAKLYRHIWGMICQFKSCDFSYYAAGELGSLPDQALHDQYLIEPDGSPDGWNRMAKFQKAVAALQTFGGNPNVNPEILTQDALNAYDGRIALKAFVPTNLKGATEYEDQCEKINSLLAPGSGKPPFPVTVKPSDDHLSRIKANIDWIHACGQLGTPLDPLAAQRVQANTAQHIAILEKQNPKAAKQIKEQLMQMEQAGQQPQQNASQGQQPAVPNAPPAGNPQQGVPDQGGAKESIAIGYKDCPPDIQRQMEARAGFIPSKLGNNSNPANQPTPKTPEPK